MSKQAKSAFAVISALTGKSVNAYPTFGEAIVQGIRALAKGEGTRFGAFTRAGDTCTQEFVGRKTGKPYGAIVFAASADPAQADKCASIAAKGGSKSSRKSRKGKGKGKGKAAATAKAAEPAAVSAAPKGGAFLTREQGRTMGEAIAAALMAAIDQFCA